MKRVNMLAAGLLAFVQTLSGAAIAAPVTLPGNTVDFTFDDALFGLFGAAEVSGDTLYFTPSDFDARSLNGAGFSLSKETLNLKLAVHDGHAFNTIDLIERGDYLLLGGGGLVDVGGQIRVFDVEAPLTDITASITARAPMTTPGLPTQNWTATAFTDVSGLGARGLNVSVENILIASTSTQTSLAFVEKKFVGLTVGTLVATPVPEADSHAMILAGLVLVSWIAMRRRAAVK